MMNYKFRKFLTKYYKILKKKLTLRNVLLTLAAIFGLFLFLGIGVIIWFNSQLPDPSVIATRRVSESTKIYDRTGEILLYDVHGDEKRTVIPWEDIPETVKNATLAAEDSDFYKHQGIDYRGVLRAIFEDVKSGDLSQGGSTITQQLIKNSLLTRERTFSRKIKEAILSIKVEREYSKDHLFWMYLNQIPYGSNIYGIEAASKTFFDKATSDLTTGEAAVLAALPQRPTYFSPYGRRVDELIGRRDYILGRMKLLGMITDEEFASAKAEKHIFEPLKDSIKAPHFVIMVREYIVEKYGEDAVQNGGLKVITTLDVDLQETAEQTIADSVDYNLERFGATNAALVAQDPKTGEVLALVGSVNYFDTENQGNFNVATSPHRQPGSSFKPYAYATALEAGFTDNTIVFDVSTEFKPQCDWKATSSSDSCYNPRNYTGGFVGPITMRNALAQSLNVPAVKFLYLAGIADTIKTAKKLGITTLNDPDRYGLALVLGGAEVKLVDMVQAYGVFANEGVKSDQYLIKRIESSDGRVIEQFNSQSDRVMDVQIARMMTSILSDNEARTPLFGPRSALYIPGRPVAAKTGTTNDARDAWTIGYTPSLVAGVWVGNNDNTPMKNRAGGSSAAAPIWNKFMVSALRGKPVESFIQPRPMTVEKPILNGEFIGPDGIHSILYYVNHSDPRGPAPTNPFKDPQFNNWELAVNQWVTDNLILPSPDPEPSPTPTLEPGQTPQPTQTPIPSATPTPTP